MSDQPAKQLSNLGVLGVAASVAGVLGGLFAALSKSSKSASAPVVIEKTPDNAEVAVIFNQEVAKERAKQAVDKGRVQAERAIAEVRARAAQVDVTGVKDSANTNLKGLKQAGAGLAAVVGAEVVNRASEAINQAQQANVPEKAKSASATARGEAKTLGAAIGDALRQNAGPIVRDALSNASSGVETGKKSAKKAREKAAPVVSDLSNRLVEQAAHAKDVVAEQAPHLQETISERVAEQAPHLKEVVAEQASQVREAVTQQAAHLGEAVSENAHVIGETLAQRKDDASSRLSSGGSAVDTYSRQAAASAGTGAKNTGSALFWGAAAAGVAYLAFLNPEQREKVKSAAGRIFEEGKAIYQDIRGYDGEFQ